MDNGGVDDDGDHLGPGVVIDNEQRPFEDADPALADGLRRVAGRIPAGWRPVIDVDRGWHPIVVRLDERLAAVDPGYRVWQCKQKLGGMRYHVEASDGAADGVLGRLRALVRDAAAEAAGTCERCGTKPARLRSGAVGGPGISTLCDKCAKRLHARLLSRTAAGRWIVGRVRQSVDGIG